MKILIPALIMNFSSLAVASTFVGNGGNVGDIELQVTVGEVQQTFSNVAHEKSDKDLQLCVCTPTFEGRPMCELLKKLNQEQVQYCARYVREKASDLALMLAEKNKVNYVWTHERIEVKEGDHLRGSDAVSDPKTMTITLNQDRYLSMSDIDREFLMTHELFHLTSNDGKLLTDEGDVGPFKGADGGRQFINAMASSVVMQTGRYDLFDSYRSVEHRSKSYKKIWVSGSYTIQGSPSDDSNAYSITQSTGPKIGLRYQFNDNWGIFSDYSLMTGDKSLLTSIKGTETRAVFTGGLAYRWFPFENPLTFAGQSHFIFTAGVDIMSGKYHLSDNYVSLDDSTSATGASVGCKYFIPFSGGLWGQAGIGYSTLRYRYDQLNLEYKNNGASLDLGVSYGF